MGDKIKNWEPDIRREIENAKNIKDIKQSIKDDADKRKIDGFNPGDILKK